MQPLYLVALLPPEPVFSQIWALKQEVHDLTGSRNAVRLPPHLTLLPPTRQAADFEPACTGALAAFAAGEAAFEVALDGFAWFGDRTLFVWVSEGDALRALHARLLAWCATHLPQVRPENRPYTPHLTLATRDLPPAQVPALRQLFAGRHYAAAFVAAQLTLFRHDGQQWQPRATCWLGGGWQQPVLKCQLRGNT
ncbi:2'-5' RNA ligase family protein [Hymenobacter cheonanensis]|uniref:2'-5' RNA ligase family protein n=1 Tax=Hymenobacter sp. CA2-7 TaxID=3063993 RepID=UPI0027134B65|nr:2'-5' RNA ligase family protein [Hymenobacter sp. CA2-7]MDO7884712.1 2'-5' RNA ligase family protein [Hymenobacter sp. CA2-7]